MGGVVHLTARWNPESSVQRQVILIVVLLTRDITGHMTPRDVTASVAFRERVASAENSEK